MRRGGIAALGLLCLAAGCGGSSPSPAHQAGAQPAPREPEDVEGSGVYDAAGRQHTCGPPRRDCPSVAPNRPFMDACVLGGYRTVQCGCETACTGKVDSQVYDSKGRPRPCAAIDEQCTPEPAGTSFQDGCIEQGYRLQQCGCEWVCSGDFTKAR